MRLSLGIKSAVRFRSAEAFAERQTWGTCQGARAFHERLNPSRNAAAEERF